MGTEIRTGLLSNNSDNVGSIWFQRDILLLALCWAITLTTSTLLTTVGPLSAQSLGASDALAAFSIGVFLFGAAMSSYPSGWMFRKLGRFYGFSVGNLYQVIGGTFGCIGLQFDELVCLMIGCFFIGLGQGLGQFYRFSAIEVSPEEFKSEAVTLVLSGGILAAFAGPTAANFTKNMFGADYLGSFFVMGILGLTNFVVVSLVNFNKKTKEQDAANKDLDDDGASLVTVSVRSSVRSDATGLVERNMRPISEIMAQQRFILSCTIATVAHTVMVMLMSNCSLAMNSHGYSFTDQTFVMEFHFCAMFLPGLYTGKFIKTHGPFKASLLGATIFTLSAGAFASGHENWNFYAGMVLLGLAWNLCFSAGTVMLTECYHPSEAPDVQAVNDVILFTVAGLGSVVSGVIYSNFGWDTLVYSVSLMMVINLALLVVANNMKTNDADHDGKRRGPHESFSELIRSYSDRNSEDSFNEDLMRLVNSEKVRTPSVA